ncbi:hypothetical protein D9753_31050 [Streptomyces dangxiongensis]|uniref:Uncharacterized protein n=1 Tax=Streptomyces dangxiongensis TaxID=1442032 RepID=A0A3G2JPK7_9ACTN|nr:hypothetical protein D9753_31050 [Streptomyces dangxiongensis]
MVRVGVVEAVEVPAPVHRETGDHVALLGDDLPQPFRRVHPTRETAPHTDDGNRIVGAVLQFADPLTGLVEIDGEALEVVDQLVVVLRAHDGGAPVDVVTLCLVCVDPASLVSSCARAGRAERTE